MERHITVPVAKEEIQDLRAGDYVYLTGVIYTARDAAHKRMDEVLSEGKELHPFFYEQHHGRYKDRSAQQDRQQQAGWTNMHHAFWIWGLAE